MKKLTALAAIVFGLVVLAPAFAQQTASTPSPGTIEDFLPRANQGDATAQYDVGIMYFNGTGVAQDDATALHWFQLAANQGLPDAQYNVGVMYRDGQGVAQDYAAALHWFQLAANQGLPDAQYNVGVMYRDGQGVAQDYAAALHWLQLAADQGVANAQFLLSFLYADGRGVAQDSVQAYMWLNLAASKLPGDKEVSAALDALAAKMTPDQIATAQRQAQEWKPAGSAVAKAQAPAPATEHAQNTAPQASPVPNEQPKSTGLPTDYSWLGWAVVVVVVMVIAIVRSRKHLSPEPKTLGRGRDGYQEAETGIPHAGYRSTKKGFEVALKNKHNDGCLVALFRRYPDNRIEVTRDALIINGQRLRPSDFVRFEHGGYDSNVVSAVGYTYGSQTEWLPGVWTAKEAGEIVLALNLHMRAFFQAQQGSSEADDLRNRRQTDF
jgi:TPR repeat protein